MKKSVICMALVFVLLSSILSMSGCTQKDNNSSDAQTNQTTASNETTNETSSDATKDTSNETPKVDFGGKTIVISGWTEEVIPKLGVSDSGDASYYALEYAKKKYNVNIEYAISPEETYFQNFVSTSLSGQKLSDIALVHCWTYASWINQNLLVPVTQYIKDEDEEHWDKNTSLFKGEIWGVNGRANSVRLPEAALFVNTKILSELGLKNPQELALKNEWTWDKFREYCRLATDPAQERYGTSAFMLPDALRYTNGALLCVYDEKDGKFYNGYTHPSTKKNALELLDFITAMKLEDKSVMGDETGGYGAMDAAMEGFKNGKLLFTYQREPEALKKSGFTDYSVVTLPLGPSGKKLDSYIDGFSFWGIPSVKDYETSDLVAFWKDAQITWDKSRGDAYLEFDMEDWIETIYANRYMQRSDAEFMVEMGKNMDTYVTQNAALNLGGVEVWDIFQQVLLGMSKPASVISATDSKIQSKIDEVLNKK